MLEHTKNEMQQLAHGNRVTETTAAVTVESVYDSANRLTSVSGVSYIWDDNSNLLSDGTSTYTTW